MIVFAGDRAGRGRNVSAVKFWVSSRHASTPNAAVPDHGWTVYDPLKTDIDARIGPKGAGAFLVSLFRADSTTLGGNKRGPRAIDLQINNNRTNANQVAGDDDSILIGGRRNSIRRTGAQANFYSAIVGGQNNYIAASSGTCGEGSFIGGGNTVNIDQAGGINCRAYIGGNTVTFSGTDTGGSGGVGGSNVTVTAPYVFVGATLQSTGNASGALFGGYSILRRARFGICTGAGGGGDSGIGAAQATFFPLGVKTSDATATLVTSDSINALANCIQIPGTTGGCFHGYFRITDNSNVNEAVWSFEGGVKNVAGVMTLSAWSAATNKVTDAALAGVTFTLGVDNATRSLTLTFAGLAATVLRGTGWIIVAERN